MTQSIFFHVFKPHHNRSTSNNPPAPSLTAAISSRDCLAYHHRLARIPPTSSCRLRHHHDQHRPSPKHLPQVRRPMRGEGLLQAAAAAAVVLASLPGKGLSVRQGGQGGRSWSESDGSRGEERGLLAAWDLVLAPLMFLAHHSSRCIPAPTDT